MPDYRPNEDEAFRRFIRRVWRDDVAPLLRDKRAKQRQASARTTGKAAAAAGLVVDSLFGLKGKPFARFMTVMGTRLGALLPDVWDWEWLRESAEPAEREVVADQVQRRAAELPEADALALFGLDATAPREELKHAWRAILQRWHPDKAPDERARAQHHVRFLAYKAAYERLCEAYDHGRLPSPKA